MIALASSGPNASSEKGLGLMVIAARMLLPWHCSECAAELQYGAKCSQQLDAWF